MLGWGRTMSSLLLVRLLYNSAGLLWSEENCLLHELPHCGIESGFVFNCELGPGLR